MALVRLLPKSALSNLTGRAARAPVPASIHQAVMRLFVRAYGVTLDEARGAIEDYATFADFFARELKDGARTVDRAEDGIVSPVDARVSQLGQVEAGHCLQAKGITFPLDKLLGEGRRALDLEGGSFITLYLSPRDYHRFHAPLGGTITGYQYLPGQFWPVNGPSVRTQDAVYALNERLVTWLDTPAGKMAYVAVGATCVARIQAAYDSVVTHDGQPARSHTYPRAIRIDKGDEIGRFEMGSTVILLFERGRVRWDPALAPEAPVRMGQRIGVFR
jgi:phosphatidylserine decarboxylase